MAELDADDVETFTNGRLLAANSETGRMLLAALAVARREAGWHVSPVFTGDIALLDGPGGSVLRLPTRKLNALTAVTEDGLTLDVTKLSWSETGSVRKSFGWWSCKYRSVSVTMTHGYTEAEAADWRQAILTMVNQMSLLPESPDAGRLSRKKVDDVEYDWEAIAHEALFSVEGILDDFRLLPVMFV